MKINIRLPKRHSERRKTLAETRLQNTNTLAVKLAELHGEYRSIGPLLFGIMYHQEIRDCPDTPAALARLAFGRDGYGTDINKGMSLAAYVSVRGDLKKDGVS